jgi:hypothetical protein
VAEAAAVADMQVAGAVAARTAEVAEAEVAEADTLAAAFRRLHSSVIVSCRTRTAPVMPGPFDEFNQLTHERKSST